MWESCGQEHSSLNHRGQHISAVQLRHALPLTSLVQELHDRSMAPLLVSLLQGSLMLGSFSASRYQSLGCCIMCCLAVAWLLMWPSLPLRSTEMHSLCVQPKPGWIQPPQKSEVEKCSMKHIEQPGAWSPVRVFSSRSLQQIPRIMKHQKG